MKAFRLLIVLAVIGAALGFAPTQALAGAFTYASAIQVQNLDNAAGNLSLIFYRQDGTIETTYSDTITAKGRNTYYPLPAGVGTGFNGSVIVTSTTKVASISNVHGAKSGNPYYASGAYIAQDSGSTTVGIPLLMKGNSGYNTWFNVQNAGTGDAHITVDYTSSLPNRTATIKPGAAVTFDQSTEAHNIAIFAATVTSDQPVVISVIEETGEVLLAYNGFASTAASTAPVFPLINENNSGYLTAVNLQNTGGSPTTVTVSYTPGSDGTACTETQTIQPGENGVFAMWPFTGVAKPGITSNCVSQKFIGSAKVTSNSAAMPLVAVVNQWKGAVNASATASFNSAAATSTVILPMIFDRRSGYNTYINLMNVGGSSTTVTCSFTGSAATQTTPAMPAGSGWVLAQVNNIANNYIGSATCTASGGGQIIAIVNELGPSGADDQLLSYEGINIAP